MSDLPKIILDELRAMREEHGNKFSALEKGQAKIEERLDNKDARCDAHSKKIAKHDTALFGDEEHTGVFETMRAQKKINTIVSGGVTAGVIAAWQLCVMWLEHKSRGGHP